MRKGGGEMTEQEIRDNAPEGATHYSKDAVFGENYYFKVIGNDVFIWQLGKRWAETIRKFNEYADIKPLP